MTETLAYDDSDRVTKRETSYGTSSSTTFDEWNRAVEETSGLSTGTVAQVGEHGARVQRAFDAAGHLVRERRYDSGLNSWIETKYERNEREQLTAVWQSHLADPVNPGQVLAGLTKVTEMSYDPQGRLLEERTLTSPVQTMRYRYDSAGQLLGTTRGTSGERQQGHDELGRVVWTSDGHQAAWRGKFDTLGRLTEEVQASGAVVERGFDKAGGLKTEVMYSDATRTTRLSELHSTVTSFGFTTQTEELVWVAGHQSRPW